MSQQTLPVRSEGQKKLQELSEEYQSLQTKISDSVQTRQRLTTQKTENESVTKVLKEMPDDEEKGKVFKLTGPVLMSMAKGEASDVVGGRGRLVGSELDRLDQQLKDYNARAEQTRSEIMRIQAEAQGEQ
ncbi:MAG: hypothetical protein Q9162_007848 [Coniocarpon cinnabarinum]